MHTFPFVTVTGLPAVLIIVIVLAIFIIGIVAVVRFVGRKAKGTFKD